MVLLLLSSCKTDSNHVVKTTEKLEIDKAILELRPNEGLMYYNNEPFTGFSVISYSNGLTAEKIEYLNGLRHGLYEKWFRDGTLSFQSRYENGLQHGKTISWWNNAHKRSQSNFENGVAQGAQFQWYTNGSIFKEIHLVDGREQGMQKSYRQNGKLYNNYEAKNGRIFGLKKATLCFSLENQEVVTDTL